MNEPSITLTPDQQRLVDRVCDAFELAFRSEPTARVECYVVQLPDEIRSFALALLIELEIELRGLSDPNAHAAEFYDRFPFDADVIRESLQQQHFPANGGGVGLVGCQVIEGALGRPIDEGLRGLGRFDDDLR